MTFYCHANCWLIFFQIGVFPEEYIFRHRDPKNSCSPRIRKPSTPRIRNMAQKIQRNCYQVGFGLLIITLNMCLNGYSLCYRTAINNPPPPPKMMILEINLQTFLILFITQFKVLSRNTRELIPLWLSKLVLKQISYHIVYI